MPVEPAREHPDVEAFQDPGRRAPEDGHEVQDVLHDGEAEPAERSVHEAVEDIVDLIAGDQVEQDDAGALQRLFDEAGP